MRAIRLLALRRLRQQPLRASLAVFAVAAGTTLGVAILVVTNSLNTSLDEFGRQLAGPTELRVVGSTSHGGLRPDVLPKVEATPGVAGAVPLVQSVVMVDSPTTQDTPVLLLGVDCRIKVLVPDLPCDDASLAAAGDRPLVVSAGLFEEFGTDLSLDTDAGEVDLKGALPVAQLDVLNQGRLVVFSLAAAQRLTSRGDGVDVIYVQPDDGADVAALESTLKKAVGENNDVLGADDPPPAIGFLSVSFIPLFGLLGLFALGTGAVLVYNTLSLSVEERRRQLAIISAVGASGRVIVLGLMAEAVAMGLLGGVLGALGGAAVAVPIVGSLSETTEQVVGVPLDVAASPGVVIVSIALGALLALGAAIIPARRAMRVDIAAELTGRDRRAEAAAPRLARRVGVWSAISALATLGCWLGQRDGALEKWQAAVAPVSFLVLSTGLLVLTANLAPLIARTVTRRARGWPGPFRLAAANLVRDPRRTGVMVSAVSATIVVTFVTAGYVHTARAAITENFVDNLDGISVSSLKPNNTGNIDSKITDEQLAALAAIPGVERVDKGIFAVVGSRFENLIGVRGFDNPFLEDSDALEGTADPKRLEGGEILIGPSLARQEGLRSGDTLRLATPDGMVELPIQGVINDGDFGGRNALLPYSLMEELYGKLPPQFVNLVREPDVSPQELADRVEAAFPDSELIVYTPNELADEISEGINAQMAPFWTMQRTLIVVAFVAVLSTLLLVGVQRHREMALLGAVGMSPRETSRMVLAEAGGVGLLAILISIPSGALSFWGLLQVIPVLLGFRNPFNPDWFVLVPYSVLAVAITLAAALIPSRRAARMDVVAGLAYE